MPADDEATEAARVALDQVAEQIDAYRFARLTRDRAIADMETARNLIEKIIGEPEQYPDGVLGTVEGEVVLRYEPHARQEIDRSVLRRRHPQIAEECTTWVIRRPFVVTPGPAPASVYNGPGA